MPAVGAPRHRQQPRRYAQCSPWSPSPTCPRCRARGGAVPGRFLLEGSRCGLDHLTLVLGETAPGGALPLHRHTYEELFIVHGGRGTYTVGEVTVEAGPGDVVSHPVWRGASLRL